MILGALDLGQWVLTGFGYGGTNVVFGDNVFTQDGPWFGVAMGACMLTLARARENAVTQTALAEVALPATETPIYHENTAGLVLFRTNNRLMVQDNDWNSFRRNLEAKIDNFSSSDRFGLRLDEMAELRPVRFREMTFSKMAALVGKLVSRFRDVSARLKNGQVLNCPVRNPGLLGAHFRKISAG